MMAGERECTYREFVVSLLKKTASVSLLLMMVAGLHCRTRKSEIYQFSFDRNKAIEISRRALTEFARMNSSASLEDYNMNDPHMSSLFARTPSGKTAKVVLVCFPHKKSEDNWAQAHFSFTPQGRFKLLSVGFRIQSFEDMLKAIQDPSKNELWGEGL